MTFATGTTKKLINLNRLRALKEELKVSCKALRFFGTELKTVLPLAVSEFRDSGNISEDTIAKIQSRWDNVGYSADNTFVSRVIELAKSAGSGTILECGSGLTTILLGLIARERGDIKIVSLEQDNRWRWRVRRAIKYSDQSNPHVEVRDAPIKYFEDGFDWYDDSALTDLPKISLIICDGPPGFVLGGRYGVVPILKRLDLLNSPTKILLDDASRPAEMEIMKRWESEFGARITDYKEGSRFALIELK